MKIAVDLDEILAEFVEGFLKYHNAVYNTVFKKEDFFCYSMWIPMKLEQKILIERVEEFFNSENYNYLKPVPGSIESVEKLSKDYRLFIVTSRPHQQFNLTKDWIDRYFPEMFTSIHFSHNHYMGGKGITKSEMCRRFDFGLIVEDSIEYAMECAENNVKVVLLDKPWNQEKSLPNNIVRAYTWKEAEEYIRTA
jgi:uncharacterized HAD superfamily protein